MKPITYRFEYYRYQLVPMQYSQLTIDNVPHTVEAIKKKKNEFFAMILENGNISFGNSKDCEKKIIYHENDKYLLLLSNNHKVPYYDDFNRKTIKSDPYAIIAIDNDPHQQIIAIKNSRNAFTSSNSIVRIFSETFNRELSYYNLNIHIEAISKLNSFWKEVSLHNREVIKLKFELIKPNMSNISNTFAGELRELVDQTNSHKTNLNLESSANGYLEDINEKNKRLTGIMNYVSEGGGSLKATFSDKTKFDSKSNIVTRAIKSIPDITKAKFNELKNFVKDILRSLNNEQTTV